MGDNPTLRAVADNLRFPEGPVALADGSLLFVEVRGGTLSPLLRSGKRPRREITPGPLRIPGFHYRQ